MSGRVEWAWNVNDLTRDDRLGITRKTAPTAFEVDGLVSPAPSFMMSQLLCAADGLSVICLSVIFLSWLLFLLAYALALADFTKFVLPCCCMDCLCVTYRLDYCGISFLIMGSAVPWLYYSFYCRSSTKIIYLAVIISLGIICITISMWDRFSRPDYRPVRAGRFISSVNLQNYIFIYFRTYHHPVNNSVDHTR